MMFKIPQFFTVILIVAIINCFGEEQKKYTQTIFLEFGGAGYFYSINYENLFINIKDQVRFGARFGYFILPSLKENFIYEDHFMFYTPFLFGKNKSKLELNLGYVLVHLQYKESTDIFSIFSSGIGYRYQKRDGKFDFRIGLNPLISPGHSLFTSNRVGFLITAYLSFGFSF